ncbi:response regulator transcription factor [Sedimentibacter saalensis]|jgi:DNA-binding NarL/FixJ family response regulator|uniref:LuxR family two component transcriptional regulator n=1 Tax=Sedimentibacter saalensis TaxID=130788 RepID=A0A562J5C2_9FIRM|nr:response regulator transcription factor [Sedimentibacter saalensis]TWH78381.1 LuxR family two component transcriptional regulator [Sedimentibacter saalensis]
MKNNVSIMLVDDHAVVRFGIRSLIEKNPGWFVCAEAETLASAYELAEKLKPDIVLLDIKLPDGDGAVGCREIKKIVPNVKIIILTAYSDDSIVAEAVKSGADGYLLKNIDSKGIITAIENVIKGASILDTAMVGSLFNIVKKTEQLEELTAQEKTILQLISMGKTNKEISKELFLADKTVRNIVSRILKKINVTNRTEAALYYIRQMSLK